MSAKSGPQQLRSTSFKVFMLFHLDAWSNCIFKLHDNLFCFTKPLLQDEQCLLPGKSPHIAFCHHHLACGSVHYLL